MARRSLITYMYLLISYGANVLMEVEEAGGGSWRQEAAGGGSGLAKPAPGAAVAANRVPLDPTELEMTYKANSIRST